MSLWPLVRESASVTMFGKEVHVVRTVQRKALLEKVVLWNGMDSSGTEE